MTRGDANNPRKRTVAVRLTDDEYARWDAARARSGRKELGAWVRAVVDELLTGRRAGRRPGDLPVRVVPEVNVEAARQLVGVATNLNQLARWANTEQRAPEVAELRRVLAEVEDALRAVRGARPRVPAARPAPDGRPAAAAGGVDEHQGDERPAADGGRRRWWRAARS